MEKEDEHRPERIEQSKPFIWALFFGAAYATGKFTQGDARRQADAMLSAWLSRWQG